MHFIAGEDAKYLFVKLDEDSCEEFRQFFKKENDV